MGLFNKKKETNAISCLVIGEDKKIMHRTLNSTGTHLLDTKNLLAHDSMPECMGSYVRMSMGVRRYLGLTSLLYETMARPFSFKTLNWVTVQHKEDQIKAIALSEGCSKAVQKIDLEGRFDRMWTLALLAVGGLIGIALIWAIQSGIFNR